MTNTPEKEDYRINRDIWVLATSVGLEVRLPLRNELFIDIDSEDAFELFQENLAMMGRLLPNEFELAECNPSASGLPHRHVVVRCSKQLTTLEQITLQALLGSDIKREIFNWLRLATQSDQPPVVFFEKPKNTDIIPD